MSANRMGWAPGAGPWRRSSKVGRVAQLHAEIGDADSDYDRETLRERLAKLAGGVAVIKVGRPPRSSSRKRKHRIEDAVRNAKAAIAAGLRREGAVAVA